MQWMHQSYKCMKAQQKKLSGCASNLLAHEDLGHFEEAHHWNIQAKFYNENSHQYMKVTTQETLYHEDHGATLKHKCGKRIVALPLLSFSLIFLFGPFLFFYGLSLFFRPESHPDLWGNHSLHHPFLTWDNALIMMIITLLFTYNSRITTQYLEQNMTLCECLWRCTRICNKSRVTCMKIMNGGFATNTMSTT